MKKVLISALAIGLATCSFAKKYEVQTALDDNSPMSLRAYIDSASNHAGFDTIIFDPSLQGDTIILMYSLNLSTGDSTFIDGYIGTAQSPGIILLDTNSIPYMNGINLETNQNTIRGIVFNGFIKGITVDGYYGGGKHNTITGCYFGTALDGLIEGKGNQTGIYVSDAQHNTIQNNVISGNTENGISIANSFSNCSDIKILNNHIGVNKTGNAKIGNGQNGIKVEGDASINNIQIGQLTLAPNIIAGNDSNGVLVIGDASSGPIEVNILNNHIGIGADGNSPLGNGKDGIALIDGSQNDTIAQNIIAYNGNAGIYVSGSQTFGNIFNQNAIYENQAEYDAAIQFNYSAQPQNGVFAPYIDSVAMDGMIFGTAETDALIQIFTDSAEQAENFIGETTADTSGNWSFQMPNLPHGLKITVMQNFMGNSSPLSAYHGNNIYGMAYYVDSTDTIKNGIAELYLKQSSGVLKLLNTYNIDGNAGTGIGVYDFSNLYPSQYLVKIIADETEYPNALKTWYESSLKWQNASVINFAGYSEFGFDVVVKELIPNPGTGTITGIIREGEEGLGSGKIQGPGDPLNGLDVSLIDKSTSSPVAFDETHNEGGQDGTFVFENIGNGEYWVHLDLPGIPIDTNTTYTISEESQEVDNIIVLVDSSGITFDTASPPSGIGLAENDFFQIVPNPFVDEVKIQYELIRESQVALSILDISGREIVAKNESQSAGRYVARFNAQSLGFSEGIYWVELKVNGQIFTKELVHIN